MSTAGVRFVRDSGDKGFSLLLQHKDSMRPSDSLNDINAKFIVSVRQKNADNGYTYCIIKENVGQRRWYFI